MNYAENETEGHRKSFRSYPDICTTLNILYIVWLTAHYINVKKNLSHCVFTSMSLKHYWGQTDAK